MKPALYQGRPPPKGGPNLQNGYPRKGTCCMKKFALILALALALTACQQPAAPVSGSSEAPAPASSEAAEPESRPDGAEQVNSKNPLAETAPKPEAPPPTTPGAVELPAQLAQAADGYSLTLLTPAQYDAFLDSGRGGPRGFLTGDVFVLGQDGKYALANPNGKLVTDFVYDGSPDGYWHAFGGYISMEKDGKKGLVNAADGSEVLPFQYDGISMVYLGGDKSSDRLAEAYTKDASDIIDLATGEVRLTVERGGDFYALHERYVVRENGMLRLYDLDFKPVGNFACDEVNLVSRIADGANEDLLAVNCDGAWALADQDGNFLTNPVYDDIGYFKGDYAPMTKAGRMGVIDFAGQIVIKPEWDDLVLYENSASVCLDGRWGVINDVGTGKVDISPRYDYIGAFGANGYACFERNGKYGLIDKEGNEMISARYDNELNPLVNLEKGYVLIDGDDGPGSAGILGPEGKVVLSSDHYIWQDGNDEPYLRVCTPAGRWGYVDRRGQFVIDAKYDMVGTFIPGRDLAFATRDGAVVLLDRQGGEVLKTVFSDVIGFNPDTMVCAMEYTAADGTKKTCLVKVGVPA